MPRAFRQMVFNVLTHNRDDHVKNFAFILDATSGIGPCRRPMTWCSLTGPAANTR